VEATREGDQGQRPGDRLRGVPPGLTLLPSLARLSRPPSLDPAPKVIWPHPSSIA
jgi:hypothetical protein